MVLPSVFVQIPSQNENLHSSKSTAGPSVRRHDEIKAELPIKSEIDNQTQSQSTSSSIRSTKDATQPPTTSPNQSTLTANLVTARPKVKCLKCELCPFMSISQDGYNNHMKSVHNDQCNVTNTTNKAFRNKIQCPGCDNIFYSKMSLKIHLVNDHQMSRSDISQLLESLFVKKTTATTNKSTEKIIQQSAQKQKIYLKNVEVLLDSDVAGEFGVQETSPTILSPIESQSECLSNSTDNDSSMGGNFDRIHVRNNFNQLNNNCMYQQVSNVSASPNNCTNQRITLRNISPLIEITSIDDLSTNRPDSGNSVKFSENLIDNNNGWLTIPSNSVSNSSFSACQTPSESPPIIPLCQNEKKKIFIKNIDILKEPIIKPISNTVDTTYRKNTLHLRTVDEVNLLINRQHDNNNFPSIDTITLSENDYRYVLNDAIEYNMPQYLDNDVNDFDIFPNEPNAATNTTDFFNGIASTSNYSITNLDGNGQTFVDGNHVSLGSVSIDDNHMQVNQSNHSMSNLHCNTNQTSFDSIDNYAIYNEVNHYFANKYLPTKSIDNGMMLNDQCMLTEQCPTEAIIDILDLTNDEVEQILDDNNLMNQEFDAIPYTADGNNSNSSYTNGKMANIMTPISSKLTTGNYMWMDDIGKINVASSLIDGKTIEMRSLEPTITISEGTNTETEFLLKTVVKKKSGRTKGARQKNGIENRPTPTKKCSVDNCGMRFATETVLELHIQCHTANGCGIRCPKCENDLPSADSEGDSLIKSPRNWNWNTLHTHLWRAHGIDMELYSCPHCTFKTPILSRLKNTHLRIHSDEKDFKCDHCSKAFKNARQMKNHRRIHNKSTPAPISQCKYCGQSFLSVKHLKEHYFTHDEAIEHQRQPFALQCDVCSETFSSKHALRVHHLNHFEEKRFSCDDCDYKTNDHNAFRRHQMVHKKQMKYKCPCCTFECIQSTNYKNHVLKKHPETAKEIMFMCSKCNFVTINKRMYDMHCLNHNTVIQARITSVELE